VVGLLGIPVAYGARGHRRGSRCIPHMQPRPSPSPAAQRQLSETLACRAGAACDVHAQSLEPPAVSLAAVLTTCADRRRGGCRTCWLAPRSSLAHVQPRECPPSLTSVCPVIHSSTSPITHSTRLAISCGRRCWPPTNPKPHPTSQRRWQHSIVTWYRACHRVHLLPPAGRPGFPLAGNELGGLP
jgi:hypothetical protein